MRIIARRARGLASDIDEETSGFVRMRGVNGVLGSNGGINRGSGTYTLVDRQTVVS